MKHALLASILLSMLFAATASAAPTDALGKLGRVGKDAGYETDQSKADLNAIVTTAIKAFLGLLGVVVLGLIVYGGFRWMNAQGNEEEITKAKDIITQAIVGLVIVMAAYAITTFVSTRLEDATLNATTTAPAAGQ